MRRVVVAGVLTVCAAALVRAAKQAPPPLQVVPAVDFNLYAGRWYEIARLPNRFEASCVGDVSATYTPRPDGQLKVINQCRKGNGQLSQAVGRARLAAARGPHAQLKVRFAPAFLAWLPFVWGDYQIIELAPDYSYAVVGEPARKYLWVLARTPRLDEALLQDLLRRAAAQGFDTSRIIRTPQTD